MKRSIYYAFHFSIILIFAGIAFLLNIDFPLQIFFLLAYVWHFTLLTPGIFEEVKGKKRKFSLLAITLRVNHFLQIIFANYQDKLPKFIVNIKGPLVRAISPVFFVFVLTIFGGQGSFLFAILGSILFEILQMALSKLIATSTATHKS